MPALQLIALETTTPQLRAPASGDTYSAPRALDITPETLTGSSATSSLSIAQTWNTTGTPTALDINVTDTASNGLSRLLDLRVGGTSRFNVNKSGEVIFGLTSGRNIFVTANQLRINGIGTLGWSANGTNADAAAADTILARDAANTLAQRNGVNAQAFNIYNTYTDASNYESAAWRSSAGCWVSTCTPDSPFAKLLALKQQLEGKDGKS